MTTVPALAIQTRKEVRALLPVWAAAMLAMTVATRLDDSWRMFGAPSVPHAVAISIYWIGLAGLGALSIGHEYANGTLPVLLSQPIRRVRHFLTKVITLSVFALSLAATAAVIVFDKGHVLFNFDPDSSRSWFELSAFILPLLCAVCLAPWLTMLSRNALAAALLTLMMPMAFAVVGETIGLARFGLARSSAPLVERAMRDFVWWGLTCASVIGAFMAGRTFSQLQVHGSGTGRLQLPWRRQARVDVAAPAPRFRRQSRTWLLVKKELHIQQWTIVLGAVFVLLWLGAQLIDRSTGTPLGREFGPWLSLRYALFVALLSGSLASAEERQMGTLDWQLSVPLAAWKQWALKAAVAMVLTLLLGLALPSWLFGLSNWTFEAFTGPWSARFGPAITLLLITAVSLYASSVCRSGLQAVLVSIVTIVALALFASEVAGEINRPIAALARPIARDAPQSEALLAQFNLARTIAMSVIGAGVSFVLLRFGLANHRSAEGGIRHIAAQAIWISASAAAGQTLLVVSSTLIWISLFH